MGDRPDGDSARQPGSDLDLTACDREPIRTPGAIQPHGLLLIADRATRVVIAGAGDLAGRLTPVWIGRTLDHLLAQDVAACVEAGVGPAGSPIAIVPGRSEAFDATLHVTPIHLIVELEPAPAAQNTASLILSRLDRAATTMERAASISTLAERAAAIFREITGFARVMVYRFLDNGEGVVVGEDRDPALRSFLHHHFPATDIPRQARELYIRNRVRVIPDVDYEPAPIGTGELDGLDLSDIALRSVSPIHLQYLRNMGVRASASVSIVKDGLLWGLIACHNDTPRCLSYEVRATCATLAGDLARQIRAKEEEVAYRERIRVRGSEDQIVTQIDRDPSIDELVDRLGDEIRGMLDADGLAVIHAGSLRSVGVVPSNRELTELSRWIGTRGPGEVFSTRCLSEEFGPAHAFAAIASGVLAVTLPLETTLQLIWFRAEEREVVAWAGNPHKGSGDDPDAMLTPRRSFDEWTETVRARSRPWTFGQIEAAARLKRRLFDARQSHRLRELNRELAATIADKEGLLVQKDHLLGEVHHRVQNSLQLVQAFLALQARESDEVAARHLAEAQRRLSAVALVHRRLHQADSVDAIDLARYIEELIKEMRGAMDEDWGARITLDLAPMPISADRAVNVGLILTELVINANKYAYGGAPGPVAIRLESYLNRFRLVVADQGSGKVGPREGFGTRMMQAMIRRLDGTIEHFDNEPGLRVIVSAPVDAETLRR